MRPRIPRPGPPVLRVPEDDIPTRTEGPHSTFRPPSRANIELTETDRMLGELMASQARLEGAWESRAREYETFRQEANHLRRDVQGFHTDVQELRSDVQALTSAQQKTGKTIGTTAKLAPAVIALIEVLRVIAQNYLGG